jgi:hypothetical protein
VNRKDAEYEIEPQGCLEKMNEPQTKRRNGDQSDREYSLTLVNRTTVVFQKTSKVPYVLSSTFLGSSTLPDDNPSRASNVDYIKCAF